MSRSKHRVLGAGHPRVAELRKLLRQGKAPPHRVLIEGPRAVGEALEHGLVPLTVVVPEGADTVPAVAEVLARIDASSDPLEGHGAEVAEGDGAEAELLVVRPSVFAKLAPAVTPQPMLALFDRPRTRLPVAVGQDDVWLVLIDVGDPGNVGTLIRAADAFGAAGVAVAGGADPWSPKAVRASAGSVLRLPPAEFQQAEHPAQSVLRSLSEAGARIVASDAERGEPHDSGVLEAPLAVVVGSEPRGLDASVGRFADAWCRIEMAGTAESLNVAMAGTLLLHQACRRTRRDFSAGSTQRTLAGDCPRVLKGAAPEVDSGDSDSG